MFCCPDELRGRSTGSMNEPNRRVPMSKLSEEMDEEDYASLADEMNDGPPHIGPWKESDWDAEAVAGGKRHAEKHGLPWPPDTGDYDRYYEAKYGT